MPKRWEVPGAGEVALTRELKTHATSEVFTRREVWTAGASDETLRDRNIDPAKLAGVSSLGYKAKLCGVVNCVLLDSTPFFLY